MKFILAIFVSLSLSSCIMHWGLRHFPYEFERGIHNPEVEFYCPPSQIR